MLFGSNASLKLSDGGFCSLVSSFWLLLLIFFFSLSPQSALFFFKNKNT